MSFCFCRILQHGAKRLFIFCGIFGAYPAPGCRRISPAPGHDRRRSTAARACLARPIWVYAEKRYKVPFTSLTQAEKMQASKELAAKKKAAVPSVYDVLACLTKCDPGTFEDFCADYGYDEDSRTAERIYFAVQKEYAQLARLFTAEQMEELAEIN